MSINSVTISGNLTMEPSIKTTPGGTSVLEFTVAVNDRRKNQQSGQWEDYANYIDCTVFGTRAEALSRIVGKGTKVCVLGKLRYSSWESNGQKRSKLSVIADDVEVMQRRAQEATESRQSDETTQTEPEYYDSEIPF